MPDRRRRSAIAELPTSAAPETSGTLHLGHLVDWSEERGPVVDCPAFSDGPRTALSLVALDATSARSAIESGQGLVLSFTAGAESQPVILGLLQSPQQPEVRVDGERVIVEGREQIELRCGKASLVLTRAGKILLRGTYVSSQSTGAQRLRGGSVEIN